MVNPISPSEVVKHKLRILPDLVITTFNNLISANFIDGSARVKQKDAIQALFNAGFNKERIFADNLLDVEDIYRSAGWRVEYDRPGYDETYEPTFLFSAPPQGSGVSR